MRVVLKQTRTDSQDSLRIHPCANSLTIDTHHNRQQDQKIVTTPLAPERQNENWHAVLANHPSEAADFPQEFGAGVKHLQVMAALLSNDNFAGAVSAMPRPAH